MARKHPSTTPLSEWPPAWLKFECADILDEPGFIMLHDHEKRTKGWPVTDEEMRDFILKHTIAPMLEQLDPTPLHAKAAMNVLGEKK